MKSYENEISKLTEGKKYQTPNELIETEQAIEGLRASIESAKAKIDTIEKDSEETKLKIELSKKQMSDLEKEN